MLQTSCAWYLHQDYFFINHNFSCPLFSNNYMNINLPPLRLKLYLINNLLKSL